MSDSPILCPICRARCTDARKVPKKDVTEYDCPRCGNYSITSQATSQLGYVSVTMQDRAKVASYLWAAAGLVDTHLH